MFIATYYRVKTNSSIFFITNSIFDTTFILMPFIIIYICNATSNDLALLKAIFMHFKELIFSFCSNLVIFAIPKSMSTVVVDFLFANHLFFIVIAI
jgi:hypothetical protein